MCSLGKPGMSLSHLRDQVLVGQLRFFPAQGRPCPRQSLTCLLSVITDEPRSGLCLTSPALPHSQSRTEETWCSPPTILYVPTLITSLNPKLSLSFPTPPTPIFCYPFCQMFGVYFFKKCSSFSCLFSSPVFLFSLHCSALCPIDHCFPSVICLATIISELFISIKSECQCQTRLPASCFDEELLHSENSGPSARSHSNECWRKVDYWVKDKITKQASWSCQSILGCLLCFPDYQSQN